MLNKVTITGADSDTPIAAMIELSAEFPFVEWTRASMSIQNGTWIGPTGGFELLDLGKVRKVLELAKPFTEVG